MLLSLKEIREAKDWLQEQRSVVHPGPIETIQKALDGAEIAIIRATDAKDNLQRLNVTAQG